MWHVNVNQKKIIEIWCYDRIIRSVYFDSSVGNVKVVVAIFYSCFESYSDIFIVVYDQYSFPKSLFVFYDDMMVQWTYTATHRLYHILINSIHKKEKAIGVLFFTSNMLIW